ncbi:DUF2235 domain-containing protein [Pseudomonas sp. zfem002]|uniref:T6SS phospholipase effector Tle1-like catalytic domain-containing protein n=1 Tax=Pseudomonas sp. zfem002 TaxID=3078197 RepID=UPI0029275B77|nr:DUF2235 domain-containing protein [Pseudomonas sp. zfem002]MDU9393366.1 DUF2235 domain-containing protein [Pseudomonas sp. zfem002]
MNPTLTLHLGLFFDGTGLNLYNSEEGATQSRAQGSYAMGRSNVARLFALYRQSPDIPGTADRASLALYIEGVGTTRGAADDLMAQACGRGASGVAARVAQVPAQVGEALRRLLECNPGVRIAAIEVDLFGFSRGAAAARHLANDLEALTQACGGYPLRLNFVGLFDTVASIMAPLKGNFSAANADFDGLRTQLPAGLARQRVQLVAADEWRVNFPLVATDVDLVLPGDHCDIGGGYRAEEDEVLVLERPFSSTEPAHLALQQTQAWRLASACLERQRQAWEALGLRLYLDSESVAQPFLPKRDLYREKRVRVRIRGERRVRGELSLVYLRLMHALACAAGVPFDPVPDSAELALPEELRPIAARLLAHGLAPRLGHGLDAAQMALLRRRYIHLSAHWNATLHSDSPLLDALFINRPQADRQRVIHADPPA